MSRRIGAAAWAPRAALAWLLSLGASACGPSVSSVCERVVEDCFVSDATCPDGPGECEAPLDEGECNEAGDVLETSAEELGCEDAFERYLDCVDEATCAWPSRCDELRLDLDVCLGVDDDP